MPAGKLKIAVLYDVWEESAQPPQEPEPEPEPKKASRRKARKKKKKKEKHDHEEVFEALQKLGHEPFYQIVDGRSQSLLAAGRAHCDLIFNLTESYAGDDTKDMNIAAFLDLLDRPYTGSTARGLYLGHDKAVAKKLFTFHSIKTPRFAACYQGKLDHVQDVNFPLIVKPATEDGSIGIDKGALVNSVKELMERIHYIHEEFDSPALVEEYIDGREIYAAVLGNRNAEVLPLIELDLSRLPKGSPRIATDEVKWEKDTEAYKLTKSVIAENIDEDTAQKISETALAAYHALKFSDYGRIDMRLKENGDVYVIEANPNPWLASAAEFAMAAKKAGRSYHNMIGEIVELALARYGTV